MYVVYYMLFTDSDSREEPYNGVLPNKRSFIKKAIYSEAIARRIMDILGAQKAAKC
jgi:hypothetical protein